MDDERRGFLGGLAAYVLWGLLTVYWHELTGLDAFGLIAWRIVWSLALLAVALTVLGRWSDLRAVADGDAVLALGLCGVAVLVLAAGYGAPPGFALVIAASWSVYGVSKKLVPLPPLEALAAETLVLAPVAVVLLLVMQAGGNGSLAGASTLQRVLVPLTGVVTTVPLLLFAFSARRVRLVTLGWLQYAVPTINLLLGVAVYDEPMPAWRVAGFAIVWAALALITVDGVRTARAEPEPVPLEG